MSNLSPAAKIAIAFIRPFRSYLDGYALIKNKRTEIEEKINEKIDYIIDDFQHITQGVSNESHTDKNDVQKKILYQFSMLILDKYDKSYDALLPSLIDNLTVELENELNKNYTQQELVELEKLVSNPVLIALLGNKKLFGLLKECEIRMDLELQMQMIESVMKTNKENIDQILSDYKFKFDSKGDTYEDHYEDDEDSTWDDENNK